MRWWWHRPPDVARAAQGAPALVRPPFSPQRAGSDGWAGAGTVGRVKGSTTAWRWGAAAVATTGGAATGTAGAATRGRRVANRRATTETAAPAVRTRSALTTERGRIPHSSAARRAVGTTGPGTRHGPGEQPRGRLVEC